MVALTSFSEKIVAFSQNCCISPTLENRKNADGIRTGVQIQKWRFASDKQLLRERPLHPAELLRQTKSEERRNFSRQARNGQNGKSHNPQRYRAAMIGRPDILSLIILSFHGKIKLCYSRAALAASILARASESCTSQEFSVSRRFRSPRMAVQYSPSR